jgi:hypothetical protein
MVMHRTLRVVLVVVVASFAFFAGWHGGNARRVRELANGSTARVASLPVRDVPHRPNPPTGQAHDRDAASAGPASAAAIGAAYKMALADQACFDLQMARERLETDEANERLRLQARFAKASEGCPGGKEVGLIALREAWSRAASLGSRDAQVHFALSPMFISSMPATELDYMRDWRERAPRYLESAAIDGDAHATLAIALANDAERVRYPHNEDMSESGAEIFAMIQTQNRAFAYRYYLLDRLLDDIDNRSWVDAAIARLESGLTTDQILTARQWAQSAASQRHH